jgi:hypothetical protein
VGKKGLLFCKKEAKNFCDFALAMARLGRRRARFKSVKVFGSLFKKNALLPSLRPPG